MRNVIGKLTGLLVALCVATGASAQFSLGATPVDLQGRLEGLVAPSAQGMEWKKLDELGVAVQIPLSWHPNVKRGAQFRTVAFSPKPLDANGAFEVGFTASLLWDKQGNTDPVRLLHELFQGIKANPKNTVIRDSFQESNGRGSVIVRYRNASEGEAPTIVHKMLVADRGDRVVWVFTFESPEAEWEEQWKMGERILGRVYLPVVLRR